MYLSRQLQVFYSGRESFHSFWLVSLHLGRPTAAARGGFCTFQAQLPYHRMVRIHYCSLQRERYSHQQLWSPKITFGSGICSRQSCGPIWGLPCGHLAFLQQSRQKAVHSPPCMNSLFSFRMIYEVLGTHPELQSWVWKLQKCHS